MSRRLVALAAVLALPFGGCASGGYALTPGGMSDAVDSFGTDHSLNYVCQRFDPATGNLTDQVTVQRALTPNAATVAALGAGFQAVVGLAGAVAKGAAVPAARADVAMPPPLTVSSCLGEHAAGEKAPPPPNPTPPAQPLAPLPPAAS